jgi:glycosyltransferase involved in cell wall biosynthesis
LTALQLRRRYDVVHVHNVPDFLVFAALVPKLAGARIILDIHDVLPELYAGKFGAERGSIAFRLLLLVERLSCRFADHVIVANHLWHVKLVQRTVPAARCTAMLNYPDLQVFKPRAQRDRADGKFVILYPGTLNHHQGLDLAVEAFNVVKDRMPDAEFHIYGEGPGRPGLVRLIEQLGLSSRVKVMDRRPLREIAQVMADADLGVVPKRADGFGNEAFSTKTLEFMAAGVPVIVARTEVDAHYFDETLVRFFVPGDKDDLARVMLNVYEHRAEHAQWIRTARDFAMANSWQMRSVEYLGIVESLVRPAAHSRTVTG